MKPTQQELTNWAIEKIKKDFKEDVALLIATPGYAMENDCHAECFDYFIPATQRGNRLAQTFILDGVGHDLYPRSWKRIENMAQLDDDLTKGLADAVILYSRSDEDTNQFKAMQEKLWANLADKDLTYRKALEKLNTAMDLYKTMMFEEALYKIRLAAGYIAYHLSLGIAYLNGTYFKQRRDLQMVELAQMKEVPGNFIPYYQVIVTTDSREELKNASYLMIRSMREFLSLKKPEQVESGKDPVYEDLADWYQEISLMWRRIYYIVMPEIISGYSRML